MNSSLLIGNLRISDSVCISIKDKKEKRDLVINECRKLNFKPKFHLVEKNKDPIRGCLESHLYCIEYAKKNKLENILILEDDVQFDGNLDKFKTTKFPENYDLIYFGYHGLSGHRINYERHIKLTSTLTTHAYVIHNSIYDYILDNINTDWYTIPEMTDLTEAEKPFFERKLRAIDLFYAKWVCHKRQQSYGLYPMVAFQRPGFSDIEKSKVDYVDLFKYRASILGNKYQSTFIGKEVVSTMKQLHSFMKLNRKGNTWDVRLIYTSTAEKYVDNYIKTLDKITVCDMDSFDILWLIKDEMALVRNTFNNVSTDLLIETHLFPYLDNNRHSTFNKRSLIQDSKKLTVIWGEGILNEVINKEDLIITTRNEEEYSVIPKQDKLIIVDDFDFFSKIQCNSKSVTLFLTKNSLGNLPFDGENFLYNMQKNIDNIVFNNENNLLDFKKRYGIINDNLLTITKNNSNLSKKLENSFYCNFLDKNYNNYLKWFNELSLHFNCRLVVFNSQNETTEGNISHSRNDLKITSHYQYLFCETEDVFMETALKNGTICLGFADKCSLKYDENFISQLLAFNNNKKAKIELSERLYQVYNGIKFYTK